MEPVETVVDAGTTLVLNCQAEGEPTPVIEWARQGRPLLGNNRFSSLSNGSLRISSAQKEDTAEYECVARNLLGSVLVRVTVTVRGGLYLMGTILLFVPFFFLLVSGIFKNEKNGKLIFLLMIITSSWRLLRVGRVGSLQCVLRCRVPEEAEAV